MLVVVETHYDPPIDVPKLMQIDPFLDSCMREHGIEWKGSLLSRDGRRSICQFEAPDAETLRQAFHRSQQPFASIWAAECVEPPAQEQT